MSYSVLQKLYVHGSKAGMTDKLLNLGKAMHWCKLLRQLLFIKQFYAEKFAAFPFHSFKRNLNSSCYTMPPLKPISCVKTR